MDSEARVTNAKAIQDEGRRFLGPPVRLILSRELGSMEVPARVPPTARFIEQGRNAICYWGEFAFRGMTAQVCWSCNGDILSELYFDCNGLKHGIEVSRYAGGAIEWQQRWRHGEMHGFALQYDDAGGVLFRSRFIRGAGLDIWVQNGFVVETREMRDSLLHGFERWGHPLLPYEERHYLLGKQAGVARRWLGTRLEEGFPKYFVDDREVSARQYQRAQKVNGALPPVRSRDDQRERSLHPLLEGAWLRKDVRRRLLRTPGPTEQIGCGARHGP